MLAEVRQVAFGCQGYHVSRHGVLVLDALVNGQETGCLRMQDSEVDREQTTHRLGALLGRRRTLGTTVFSENSVNWSGAAERRP